MDLPFLHQGERSVTNATKRAVSRRVCRFHFRHHAAAMHTTVALQILLALMEAARDSYYPVFGDFLDNMCKTLGP